MCCSRLDTGKKKKKELLDVQIGYVLLTKLKKYIDLALPAYFLK